MLWARVMRGISSSANAVTPGAASAGQARCRAVSGSHMPITIWPFRSDARRRPARASALAPAVRTCSRTSDAAKITSRPATHGRALLARRLASGKPAAIAGARPRRPPRRPPWSGTATGRDERDAPLAGIGFLQECQFAWAQHRVVGVHPGSFPAAPSRSTRPRPTLSAGRRRGPTRAPRRRPARELPRPSVNGVSRRRRSRARAERRGGTRQS